MKKTCDQTFPVGYGSPPVATRFAPGVSGNPAGRPKGQQNFRSALVLLRHKFRFAVLWWRQHGHRGRVPTIA